MQRGLAAYMAAGEVPMTANTEDLFKIVEERGIEEVKRVGLEAGIVEGAAAGVGQAEAEASAEQAAETAAAAAEESSPAAVPTEPEKVSSAI